MKTLSLSRPLILILVGLPGSGKSFFARQFSDMFDAPIVSFDRLRAELFAQPQFSATEYDIIRRVAAYQMGELVKTHRSFIVDGGCNTLGDRQRLDQLAKQHGYGTLIIWVQTDDITCRMRATKRKSARPEDAITPSITEGKWAEFAKRFNAPTREPYMVISGKHAFSTQAKMVLRKLATPHARAVEETAITTQERPNPAAPTRATEVKVTPPRPRTVQRPVRRSVIIN